MGTRNSRITDTFLGARKGPSWLQSVACGVVGMAAWSGVAAAQTTPPATTGTGPVVIDARRSLPIFPANSWKDGFFVEHSPIGDFGLHIRGTGIYGRDPLGRSEDVSALVQNRFTLHAAALVSIAGWVELGAAMPFVLYQDGSGLQLSKAAIGDLRLLGKINMHLPDKGPQVAFSLGLGFQTATNGSAFGAGNISGYPRIIIDMPKLLSKRLHIAGNLGAVIAGTSRPCTADELALIERQNQQMMMPMMGTMTPGTGMNMMTTSAPACEQRVLGLGNHIMWGVGASGALSPDNGLYITTELIGSFSVGSELATNSPLFWTVGLRRAKANKTFFTAAYGYGLTDSSPGHTVIASLGLVWETEPPAKKKDPPTVKVDINVSGLPSGANISVGGKDGAKTAQPAKKEGGDKPAGDKPAGDAPASDQPPPPPKPPKTTPYNATTEVDLPEGLVPDEAKKGDSKGKK